MRMIVTTQVEPLLEELRAAGARNAGFALRWAANVTAWDVSRATTDVMLQRFTASTAGRRFLVNHVKVLSASSRLTRSVVPRGTDLRTASVVGVIPPGEGGRARFQSWARYRGSLVPMLEAGGLTPGPRDFAGDGSLGRYWIPERRSTDRRRVPMSMFPINLGLQARRSIEGGLVRGQLRGKRRTFLIRSGTGKGTIFQRYGRGRSSELMPLYFTHQQARLPARRFFFPTAQRVVGQRFPDHLRRAIAQSMFGRGAYRGYAEHQTTLGPRRA